MNQADPYRALLESVVTVARAIFAARAASIMLHDRETDELVFRAVSGEGAGSLVGMRFPAAQGIAGWVLMSGQPLVIEDVAADPRFARDVAERTSYVPQGLMAVPLLAGEDALGVLQVLDRPLRSRFSVRESEILGLIGEQAALALALAERAATAPGPRGAVARLGATLDRLDADARERADSLLDALAAVLEPRS